MADVINVKFITDGNEHHLVVSLPAGGGCDGYHVNVDNYYHGSIVRRPYGWESHVLGNTLYGEDIGVIIDLINEIDPIIPKFQTWIEAHDFYSPVPYLDKYDCRSVRSIPDTEEFSESEKKNKFL